MSFLQIGSVTGKSLLWNVHKNEEEKAAEIETTSSGVAKGSATAGRKGETVYYLRGRPSFPEKDCRTGNGGQRQQPVEDDTGVACVVGDQRFAGAAG